MTAKETQETEDFKKYLTNARNKVSLFALSHISDVPTRTEIDSFVIAFDQLEERYYYLLKQLEEYASQSKWVSVEEFIKAVKDEFPDMDLDYLNFVNDRINKPPVEKS